MSRNGLGDWVAIGVVTVAEVQEGDKTLEDLGIMELKAGQTIIKCADAVSDAKMERDYQRVVSIKDDWRKRAEKAESKLADYEHALYMFTHAPFAGCGGVNELLTMLRNVGWEEE